MDISDESVSLTKLLELICTRPQMFVADGSFLMVATFLDGYTWAMQQLSGKSRDEMEWNGFRIWLADRCYKSHGIARNLGWQCYVKEIYSDDKSRFEHLPFLFSEYLTWVASGNDPQNLYAEWLA